MKHYFRFLMTVAIIITAIFVITGCSKLENPTNIESENIASDDLTQEQIDQQIDCLKKATGTQSTLAASQGCPSYQRSEVVSPKNNQDVLSPVKLKWTKCVPPDCYSFYCYYPHVYNSQDQLVAMGIVSDQNTLEWSRSLDPGDYSWNILAKWKSGQYGDWGPSKGYFKVVEELQVSSIIGPSPAYRSSNPRYYVNVSGGTGTYSYIWKVYNIGGQTVGTYYTVDLYYSQFGPVAAGNYRLKVWVTSGSQTKSKERWITLY